MRKNKSFKHLQTIARDSTKLTLDHLNCKTCHYILLSASIVVIPDITYPIDPYSVADMC